jgi:hypothetical protein
MSTGIGALALYHAGTLQNGSSKRNRGTKANPASRGTDVGEGHPARFGAFERQVSVFTLLELPSDH